MLVDTDISIAVPAGTYGRVAPRSGLASKHSIDVGAGVIDADYRGPVKVLLFNFSEVEFKVEVGERVAQLIVERVSLSSYRLSENGILIDMTDLHTGSSGRSGIGRECERCWWIWKHGWIWRSIAEHADWCTWRLNGLEDDGLRRMTGRNLSSCTI